MAETFMQLARWGKNQWWRYILAILLILVIWQGSGFFILLGLVLFVELDNNPATRVIPNPFEVEGISPSITYAIFNLSFIFFLLGIFIAVHYLHRRRFRSLVTPARQISWGRLGQGFGVFFVIQLVSIIISYLLSREDFMLTFEPQDFFVFLPLALILTPLQTGAEEIFFRGYLLQGLGLKLKTGLAIALTSVIFMAFHLLNPEVLTQVSAVGVWSLVTYYLMFGLFLAWLSVKDNSLELAIGLHTANNLAIFLFITSENTVLQTPAVFTVPRLESDFSIVFSTAVKFLLFAWIVFKWLRRPTPQPAIGDSE